MSCKRLYLFDKRNQFIINKCIWRIGLGMNNDFSSAISTPSGFIYSANGKVVNMVGLKYPENFLFRDT
jgi:hypothetical protein